MLNYEFPPIGGGAGKAHLCILKEFAKTSALKVDILTSAPKPGFTAEKLSDGITIYKVGLHKKNLHYWRKSEVIEWLTKSRSHYRRLLRDSHYDLVHAFFAFPSGWLCYRTAKQLPYIISLRGSDVPGYNIRLGMDYKLLAGLFRRIWSSASAIVANSEGLKNLASQFMPELDIKVIPNGIDTERFHPAQSHKLSKPVKALTVCRLISRKRIDLLIKAVAAARDMGLDIHLSIAGDGNLAEQLQKLSADIGVTDKVSFLDRVTAEEMPDLYRGNHIFLMSSAHEGMSNAMLEAMASGLPIITTPCEGVEELVGNNGVVVEQASPQAIAVEVKAATEKESNYRKMSEAAVKRARRFGWKIVADEYLSCYHSIIETVERAER
ncbi:D-inositol-3-phosphate glycosyltransferase [subsurface metagenome]